MPEMPGAEGGTAGYKEPAGGNGFLQFLSQPRIVLLMLAGWEAIGFLVEFFTSSAFFLENHGEGELTFDGALGGRALGWEAIPLGVLYLYCARDPERYWRVFWLALIEQGAAIAANLYHWLITDDFSFESVAIPLLVAVGLGTLSFMNIFQKREEPQPEAAA
jgi:hypothetical protein